MKSVFGCRWLLVIGLVIFLYNIVYSWLPVYLPLLLPTPVSATFYDTIHGNSPEEPPPPPPHSFCPHFLGYSPLYFRLTRMWPTNQSDLLVTRYPHFLHTISVISAHASSYLYRSASVWLVCSLQHVPGQVNPALPFIFCRIRITWHTWPSIVPFGSTNTGI